jgi:uncharacterized protein (TIGR03643 family)
LELKPYQLLNAMKSSTVPLSQADVDRIIEMAWEDRTSFELIKIQFGLTESQVIILMKRELHPRSWIRWRKRVKGRSTKHAATSHASRFKCSRQKSISLNKISKR